MVVQLHPMTYEKIKFKMNYKFILTVLIVVISLFLGLHSLYINKIKKSNKPTDKKDFLLYLFSYCIVLIFTCIWGILNSNDLHIIFFGFVGWGLCFVFLIQIRYPQSLGSTIAQPTKLKQTFDDNKSSLVNLVVGGFLGLFLIYAIPLTGTVLYPIFYIDGYWFAFTWILCIVVITLFGCYRKELHCFFPWIKQRFLLVYGNFKRVFWEKNEKTLTFLLERSNRKPLLLYLAFLTLVSRTPLIIFPLCLYSFRFHQGGEIFWCFFLAMLTTFIVSLPPVQRYISSTYGPQSLHLVGWNSPGLIPLKYLGYGLLGGGAALGYGLLSREMERIDQTRKIAHELKIRKQLAEHNLWGRTYDPAGANAGLYNDIPLNQPLPTRLQLDKGVSSEGHKGLDDSQKITRKPTKK